MKLATHELARRLDLPDSTLDRWIRQGRIPVQRVGEDCVFDERELREWAAAHRVAYVTGSRPDLRREPPRPVRLEEAARRGGIHRLPELHGVGQALSAMSDRVPGLEEGDRRALLERLEERERLSSTGIGRGVAVPHPRSPVGDLLPEPMVVIGFLPVPIDFGSVDGNPASTLFLLLAPTVKVHLALLSRLAFCLQDDAFVQMLHSDPDDDTVWRELERIGSDLTEPERS